MKKEISGIQLLIRTGIKPREAFNSFIPELVSALQRRGTEFNTGPKGTFREDDFETGKIISWEPGKHIRIQWRPAKWEPDQSCKIGIVFEPSETGSIIEFIFDPDKLTIDEGEITGWIASSVVAPLIQSVSPRTLGDWITDRRARKPSGEQSRNFYRDPLYHYPFFRVILSKLALKKDDRLLDVCCGGGAFLKDALASGCTAAGIDHSHEMIDVAGQLNKNFIDDGRLELIESVAENMPFNDESFTCAAMTGALGFLPDPVRVFKEIFRVLGNNGRMIVQGSDPAIKGTPAAPYPIADRLQFYNEQEFEKIATEAGFRTVDILKIDLEPYARDAGIPEEHIPLFSGSPSLFLSAVK